MVTPTFTLREAFPAQVVKDLEAPPKRRAPEAQAPASNMSWLKGPEHPHSPHSLTLKGAAKS